MNEDEPVLALAHEDLRALPERRAARVVSDA